MHLNYELYTGIFITTNFDIGLSRTLVEVSGKLTKMQTMKTNLKGKNQDGRFTVHYICQLIYRTLP